MANGKIMLVFLTVCQVLISMSTPVESAPFQLERKPVSIVRGVTSNVTLRCDSSHNAEPDRYMSDVDTIRILREEEGVWVLFADIRAKDDNATSYDEGTVVSGNASAVEESYLEVVWPVATADTFGTYRCDVIGFETNLDVVTTATGAFEVAENDVTAKGLLDFLLEDRKKTEEDLQDLREYIDSTKDELLERVNTLDNRVGYYGK